MLPKRSNLVYRERSWNRLQMACFGGQKVNNRVGRRELFTSLECSASILILFNSVVVRTFVWILSAVDHVFLSLTEPSSSVVADSDCWQVHRHRRRVRLAERLFGADAYLLLAMPVKGLEVEETPSAGQRLCGLVTERKVLWGRDVVDFVVLFRTTLYLYASAQSTRVTNTCFNRQKKAK